MWPNQSLVLINPEIRPEKSCYGLVYFKEYGLILNKIYQEQGNCFIKYQTTTDDFLLLKIDLNETWWFGQLIELRLEGQALADYF
ncbi:Uncharacterised protein [Legionella beliardensis]|uniref:Uncharacterized protein n=1 Tax=Legionella beliardensis TaxID=91822 RepID=A0A378JPR2_9GAMM|nr:hypothetical protein [Legionella beliardensis]STX55784.1 Uncharacterised protein [Legionella beliardensis]